METVYEVIAGSSRRYIRAISKAAAKVRAFKVWGLRDAQVTPYGNNAPAGIGQYGYQLACGRYEMISSGRDARAMHKGGTDHRKAMYLPSQAAKTKTNNKAADLMASLGLTI